MSIKQAIIILKQKLSVNLSDPLPADAFIYANLA